MLVLGIVGGGTGSAKAQNLEQAQQDKANAQANIRATQAQSQAIQEKKGAVTREIADMSSEISKVSDSLFELEQKEAQKNEELEVTKVELAKAEEIAKEQYANMKIRIRYMYENGKTDFIAAVLSAKDFSSLLNRAEYVKELSAYDRNMLNEYEESLQLIATKKAEIEKEQKELAKLKEETLATKEDLENKVKELTITIQVYAEELAALQNQIKTYEAEAVTASQVIETLMAEARKAQEQEALRKAQEAAAKAASEAAATAKASGTSTTSAQTPVTPSSSTSAPASGTTTSDLSGVSTTGTPVSAGVDDLNLLAAIIYCESGGEPYIGQVAVGSVVLNRLADPRFPNTMSGVIYQKHQFTPAGTGFLNLVLTSGVYTKCIPAAQAALAGEKPVGGCLFFNSLPGTSGYKIGGHTFY